MNPVSQAFSRIGGPQGVADMCDVTVRAVYKWIDNQVPAERAIEIEQKTNGAVTLRELRPDLFEHTAA